MSDHWQIEMRVGILRENIKPPRLATTDEISACTYELARGLVDLGGVRQLENAIAVMEGVTTAWPEPLRPSGAEIAKLAAWAIRQDPMRPQNGNIAPLAARIEEAIAGRLVAIPWPWAGLGGLTQALLPGAITLLVGSPGASKSFMLFQAALWWLQEGWRVAVYALEEDPAFWLNRALALCSGVGLITDPAWMATHPEQARTMLANSREELERLAANLVCAPPQGIDLRGLAEWIAQRAKAGDRIICADPITAASVGAGKPWLAAEDFMLRAKRAVVEHGASLVLTSHGRKADGRAKGPPDLDALAGGAAYARFASSVLWLEACDQEPMDVVDADGRDRIALINRRLRILKARNGAGTGKVIGMWFDGQTLRASECGITASGGSAHQPKQPPKPATAAHQADRLRQPPSPSEDLFKSDTP